MQDGKITARSQQDHNKIGVRSERIVFTLVMVDKPAMKRIFLITAALLCSLSWAASAQDFKLAEDRFKSLT